MSFVHEHDGGDKADEKKARFFAACRDGRIAVAISSTPKMGIGTNVQSRLLALHHLDCPWRPSDIEQREGRILRQGNRNPVVQIYAYAVEQSFAVNGWQTIERKAGFIGQIMRADPNGPRILEPDDAEALAYGQIKAIATGDPDFLKLADLEDRMARLERLQRGHHQEQAALARQEQVLQHAVAEAEATIARRRPTAELVRAHPDEVPMPFHIAGATHTNRGGIARALGERLRIDRTARTVMSLEFGDSRIWIVWSPRADVSGWFEIHDLGVRVRLDDTGHSTLVGALTRTINAVRAVPDRLEPLEQVAIPDYLAQLERARSVQGVPFAHSDDLRATRQEVGQLRQLLEERYADKDEKQTPSTSPAEQAPEPSTPSSDARSTMSVDESSGTSRLSPETLRRRLDSLATRQPPDLTL